MRKFDMEWNLPTRSDHYLMQIALFVRSLGSKKKAKLDKMKINFKKPKRKTPQEAQASSKARWIAAVGASINRIRDKLGGD